MAAAASDAIEKTRQMLSSATGLAFTVAALAEREQVGLPQIDPDLVIAQQVAFETAERTAGAKYPAVYVYCEGLANLLREKFRTFSGKAFMALEVRVSHDRLEEVSERLRLYTAAATDVLDANRGDWSDGMFYAGAYKVEFGPIKRGGKNFLQTAKITFEVEVSR